MSPKNLLLHALLRNLALLLLGVLLVTYSAEAPKWIVMGCGVLFILPGAVALLSLITDRDTAYMPMLPFTAGGSILLGIYLLCFPDAFIAFLLYALAGVLVMAGTMGCLSVWRARRTEPAISAAHFLFPTLLFVAGILVMVFWHDVAPLPFLIMGYALIFYAPLQMLTAVAISRALKRAARAAAPEEVMIEISGDKPTDDGKKA